MSYKKEALGFGFLPNESQHHFLVKIPRNMNDHVIIYERFQWHNVEGNEDQPIDFMSDIPKVELSKHKWKQIEDALRIEFNERLKKEQLPVGKWKIGEIPVQRLFGKEMVLLAWAIEDSDPSVIPSAIKNWLGLSIEERWWLFTMTNAATGYVSDKRGWRKAIRYALTENPIEENDRQMSLFDMAIDREIDK
ncbi:DUF3780 domain-containing protein [Peribacillus frigoritolerans]|uniref:DUF3780 domain-containing protein n=1 Tax=Peribacillus frigoritolerans TaxID=450367 RepID=UPI002E236A3E|nr:DUF3780 domain-containing protein [Peribacillus frigoritolerans]